MSGELVAITQDEWDRMVSMWLHGRPQSTRDVYLPVIDGFREFVDNKRIGQLTLEDLQNYAGTLAGQKPRTVERKLATIKSLLGFCHRIGFTQFDVGRALRLPKIPDDLAEKILPEEDIQRMIALESDQRNQVLLRVLYGAGIRASEAAGLRWINVQSRSDGSGQITVLGKGSKTRTIKLSVAGWKALQSLRPEHVNLDDPVFARQNGGPMSRNHITIVVTRAARRANIPRNVSAHWMRHAHATHAIDHKAPLALVQRTLGHATLAITGKYVHVRPDESSSKYLNI